MIVILILSFYLIGVISTKTIMSSNILRNTFKSESILNSKFILLPNLLSENNEELNAVFDRIYRAASGKYIQIV